MDRHGINRVGLKNQRRKCAVDRHAGRSPEHDGDLLRFDGEVD